VPPDGAVFCASTAVHAKDAKFAKHAKNSHSVCKFAGSVRLRRVGTGRAEMRPITTWHFPRFYSQLIW
jgi:hypothetical protein